MFTDESIRSELSTIPVSDEELTYTCIYKKITNMSVQKMINA